VWFRGSCLGGSSVAKSAKSADFKILIYSNVDLGGLIRRSVGKRSFQFEPTEKKESIAMKYMLLIYHEEQAWGGLSEQERQEMYAEYGQFTQEIMASGHYVAGSELHPVSTATSVRVRDGQQLATDGPFAETKEQLGGYYLIEANDLDEAIGIAARIPSARAGTIEVRPVSETAAPASA
jgi:hypothetical protein